MTSKELLDELAPSKENANQEPKDSSKSDSEIELNENQLSLQDLNWLLREGAVIAFGDGKIELATPKTQEQVKLQMTKEKID